MAVDQKVLEVVLELRDKLSKQLDQTSKKATASKGAFAGLGSAVGKLGVAFAGIFAAGKVIDFLKASSKAAAESESIYARLNAAVIDNKGATAQSAAAIDAYNQKLSQRLALDDEALNSVSAQIASLTNLSANAIPQATQATAALAAKLGIELPAAGAQMARFLSGATDKLRGTTLEVKAGATEAERLAAAMQFAAQGLAQAEAQAATTEGQTKLLAINWGNFTETIGEFINSSPLYTAALKGLNEGLVFVTTALQGGNPQFEAFKEKAKEAFEQAGRAVMEFLKPAFDWFMKQVPAMRELWESAVSAINTFWKKHGEEIKIAWETIWGAIKAAGALIWATIKTAFEIFTAALTGVFKVWEAVMKGDWQGAWEAIKQAGQTMWNAIVSNFTEFGKTIVRIVSQTVETIKSLWQMRLANPLIHNSIIPDMNEAILRNFMESGADLKKVVSGVTQELIDRWGYTEKEVKKITKSLTAAVKVELLSLQGMYASLSSPGDPGAQLLADLGSSMNLDDVNSFLNRAFQRSGLGPEGTGPRAGIGAVAEALNSNTQQQYNLMIEQEALREAVFSLEFPINQLAGKMDYLASIGLGGGMFGKTQMGAYDPETLAYTGGGPSGLPQGAEVTPLGGGLYSVCTDGSCRQMKLGGQKGGGGGQQQKQQFDVISGIFNQQLGQALAQGILTNDWSNVGNALAQSVSQSMQQLFSGMGPLGGFFGGLAGGLLGGVISKLFGGGRNKRQGATPQDALFVHMVNAGDMATSLLNAVKGQLANQAGGGLTSLRAQLMRI